MRTASEVSSITLATSAGGFIATDKSSPLGHHRRLREPVSTEPTRCGHRTDRLGQAGSRLSMHKAGRAANTRIK
jgi:hypothetical protein